MNRAYLSYIHYMHSNHKLNEYLAKICMHLLLRPLPTVVFPIKFRYIFTTIVIVAKE